MKKSIFTVCTIIFVAFTYTIVRYNIYKGLPFADLPLFLSNKAIALSALALLALAYMFGSLARFFPSLFVYTLPFRKLFGLLGFGLAAIHGLMSLLLFTPAHYPKFFLANEQLNVTGELSMLFGVLAFAVFTIVACTSAVAIAGTMTNQHWLYTQRLGYLGLGLVFLHVFIMGVEGWTNPASWPGGLWPISLVSAVIAAGALLVKLVAVIFTEQLPFDPKAR